MTRDPLEIVTVELDGQALTSWTSFRMTLGVEQAVRAAELEASDFGGSIAMAPGMPCRILASGDLILTGYVRDVTRRHDAARHSIALSIVSRTVDAAEASIDHATGFLREKGLTDIAKAFDTSGIGVEADEDFPPEPASFVNTGATLIEHLRPLARSHSAMMYDTAEGKLRLRKSIRGRHAGALAIGPGGNILAGQSTFSEKDRFSTTIVRGQTSRGSGAGALRIEARASDPGVKRHRPRIIVHESETTSGKLRQRAERAVKKTAGASTTASIEVAGWRDQAGRIFEPHFLVEVADARLQIEQEMAIRSVTLEQSTERGGPGTRCRLDLCDPRALNGEVPVKGGGGTAAYDVPMPTGTIGIEE